MKKILAVIFSLLMTLSSAKADDFTAGVENNQVVLGEPFELQLSYSGDDDSVQPDLSVLQPEFQVYANGSSQQTSYINGVVNQRRDWTIGLIALKEGKVQIPAIKAGKLSSESIDLTVLPAGSSVVSNNKKSTSSEADNAPKFSVDFELDNQNPYVKQEVIGTLIIKDYVGLEFASDPAFGNADDWKIKIIGQPEVSKISGGREIKLRFIMFPQKAGEQTVPTLQWSAYYFDISDSGAHSRNFGFFDMSGFSMMSSVQKPVILQAKPQKINVKSVPAEYGNQWWLPAKALTLSGKWVEEKPLFKVGEAVTREVVLSAVGVLDSELPDLHFTNPQTLKQYPEKPQYSLNFYKNEPIAQATYRIVYIPQTSGEVVLPEIKLVWFNAKQNKMETAVMPSQKLQVEPNPEYFETKEDELKTAPEQAEAKDENASLSAPNNAQVDNNEKINPILWLVIAFVMGMLLSYLLFSGRLSADSNEDKTLKNIDKYLKNNDYRRLRDNLIKWGNENYPDVGIHNLNDLATLVKDDDFVRQMQILNRTIYSETDEKLNPNMISTVLKKYLKQKNKNKKDAKPLPPLYG